MRAQILIIDDSATARLGISQALRKRGYEPVAVATAAELEPALDWAKPALLLVDVHMPELFGDDLVRWLRQSRRVEVPILLCSTRSETDLARLSEECGADGWVRKNGRPDEIAALVERHLADGEV